MGKKQELAFEGITLYGPHVLGENEAYKITIWAAVMKPTENLARPHISVAQTIAYAEQERQEDNAQFMAFDLANRLEIASKAGGVMVVVSMGRHEMATVIRGEFMQDWDAKLEVYEQIKLRWYLNVEV